MSCSVTLFKYFSKSKSQEYGAECKIHNISFCNILPFLFQSGYLLLPLQVDQHGTSDPTVALDDWWLPSPEQAEQEGTDYKGTCLSFPAPGLPGAQGSSKSSVSDSSHQDGVIPTPDDRCGSRRLLCNSQGKRKAHLEAIFLLNKSLLSYVYFLGESFDIYLRKNEVSQGFGTAPLPWQHPLLSRFSSAQFSVCFYSYHEPNLKGPVKAGTHSPRVNSNQPISLKRETSSF